MMKYVNAALLRLVALFAMTSTVLGKVFIGRAGHCQASGALSTLPLPTRHDHTAVVVDFCLLKKIYIDLLNGAGVVGRANAGTSKNVLLELLQSRPDLSTVAEALQVSLFTCT